MGVGIGLAVYIAAERRRGKKGSTTRWDGKQTRNEAKQGRRVQLPSNKYQQYNNKNSACAGREGIKEGGVEEVVGRRGLGVGFCGAATDTTPKRREGEEGSFPHRL